MLTGATAHNSHSVSWLTLGLFIITVLVCTLGALEVRAQEYEYSLFERAKNAYDRGEYTEAVSRFDEMLKSGLNNPALVLECHKLLGVSYLFIGDLESAERHFDELLTREPDFNLDPMLFPIEVIDFFLEIKAKNDRRLEDLKQARALEEERRRIEDEKRRAEELEALKRNVYLERNRKQNSILVAMMPLGAGQFQNDQVGKGVFFLGGELLLTTATISTYFLHASMRKDAEPFSDPGEKKDEERLEATYRIVNQTSAIALGALALWGIVDSLFNYEPETITWNDLKERDVPEEHRPGKSKSSKLFLAPYLGSNEVGVGISGSF